MLSTKKLLYKILGLLTPQVYTGYTFRAYTATDLAISHVYVWGKLCIYSIAMTYTADHNAQDTQVFISNMPKPAQAIYQIGTTASNVTTDASRNRSFRYRINDNGEIQNWYSGLKTYANQVTIFSGVYVIK